MQKDGAQENAEAQPTAPQARSQLHSTEKKARDLGSGLESWSLPSFPLRFTSPRLTSYMNSDPVPSLGSYPRGGAQRFPVYLPASNQQAVCCLRAESRLRTSLCGRARSFAPRWRRGQRRCQPAAVRKGGGIPSSGKSGTKPIGGKGWGHVRAARHRCQWAGGLPQSSHRPPRLRGPASSRPRGLSTSYPAEELR